MVYILCKYPDDFRYQKKRKQGFDTVVFELPSYEIVEKDGNYTDQEIEEFRQIVERGAHLFFKYARNGGLKFAQYFRNNAVIKYIFGLKTVI